MNDLHATSVLEIWERMALGWATGSADVFASAFADDVDFVSVDGTTHKGSAQVCERHAKLFAGPYRTTTLIARPEIVRDLGSGLVLVHARSQVLQHDGAVLADTHAQAVVAEHKDRWRVIAFHNMVPHGVKPAQDERSS